MSLFVDKFKTFRDAYFKYAIDCYLATQKNQKIPDEVFQNVYKLELDVIDSVEKGEVKC